MTATRQSSTRRQACVLAALLLGALAGTARAETLRCIDVNALPAGPSGSRTIASPGVYCLTADLSYTSAAGNAITIAADSVVLDLNGFEVRGRGGRGLGSIGIYALNRKNVTIRNGKLDRFEHGIVLASATATAAQGNLIEDMLISNTTTSGINVHGFGSIVRHNRIRINPLAGGPNVWGIGLLGRGHRVIDNDVIGSSAPGGPPQVRGIWVNQCRNVLVVNNRIDGADYGVLFDGSTGAIRDNVTSSVDNPYPAINGFGYVDAGNNR